MSIKNKYIGILLIATTMLLSACSSDNPEAQTVTTVNEPVGKEVQLMSYASPFTDQELSHRAAPAGFTAHGYLYAIIGKLGFPKIGKNYILHQHRQMECIL